MLAALALLSLALSLRLSFAPPGINLRYDFFFPAVMLAACIGGQRAGILSTLGALALAHYFLTPPFHDFSLEGIKANLWPHLIFLLSGIGASLLIRRPHGFREKFEQEVKKARAAQAHAAAVNHELVKTIAELRQTEGELRIAAVTFESRAAIMITDAAATIVRVNQSFIETTGYSAAEVIGRNPRILKSGRHNERFYEAMWQEIGKTGHWTGEIWDRHKSGAIYPKEMTITAIKNADGRPTHYVSIFRNITERKQVEQTMHDLAFYDPLTELPNRRLLTNCLESAIEVSARCRQYAALMFLDLDRFKALNDTLGHNCGDLLLSQVAQRLRHCVRKIDTVARLGGDEFVVLIENMSEDQESAFQQASLVAEKIRSALNAPYQLKERAVYNSPSIGFYLFRGNSESVEELLIRADAAMYQAKNAGRNTVHFAIQLAASQL